MSQQGLVTEIAEASKTPTALNNLTALSLDLVHEENTHDTGLVPEDAQKCCYWVSHQGMSAYGPITLPDPSTCTIISGIA